jgi:hypothetical protein
MTVLGLIAALTLLVLPGGWISFGLLRRLQGPCQWALAVAFSPAIVALQVVVLALVGVGFSSAAWVVALVNLPAAWLFWRRSAPRRDDPSAPSWVWVISALALFAPVAALLLCVPGLRTFGWHHMMQLSAIAEIRKLPAIPEEMDLAGVRLNYGWMGHIALAAMSTLADRTPTLFYPIVNASALVAMFVPLAETARRARPANAGLMTLGAAAACLSAGLISMLAAWPRLATLVTEIRPIPLVAKLPFIDSMNVGLALLAGYIFVAVEHFRAPRPGLWLHTGIFVLGIGISYPLLFPSAALVAIAVLAGLWLRRSLNAKSEGLGEMLATALALGVAVAGCLAYTRFMQAGRHVSVVTFDLHSTLHGAKASLLIFGPWGPVVLQQLLRAIKQRDVARLVLIAGGAANLLAFLLLSMPAAVQYKFLFAVGFCWAPAMADWFTDRFQRLGLVPATGALVLLSVLSAGFMVRIHPPGWSLERVAVDERAFPPRAAEPGWAWLNAVRDGTPANTLIVHQPSFVPTSVLADRAAYIQSDALDNEPLSWRLGYSMSIEIGLLGVKSYPVGEYRMRQTVIRQVFANAPVDGQSVTQALLSLHRPVAIWFPERSSYSSWLAERGVGEAKFGEASTMTGAGSGVLWYIPETRAAPQR